MPVTRSMQTSGHHQLVAALNSPAPANIGRPAAATPGKTTSMTGSDPQPKVYYPRLPLSVSTEPHLHVPEPNLGPNRAPKPAPIVIYPDTQNRAPIRELDTSICAPSAVLVSPTAAFWRGETLAGEKIFDEEPYDCVSNPDYAIELPPQSPHLRPERVTLAKPQRHGTSFLDIPGEIRNRIYWYALDMGSTRVPSCPVSTHTHSGHNRSTGIIEQKENDEAHKLQVSKISPKVTSDTNFGILRLCRQIAFEAGSLFINQATAYIPITPRFNLPSAHRRVVNYHPLHPFESTIISAMTDVKDLHIHLHLDLCAEWLSLGPLELLSHTLQHIKSAQITRWGGQRRNVTIHLDHFLADDRRHEFPLQSGCIHKILGLMDQMKNSTDFTLCYYAVTGEDAENPLTTKWQLNREAELYDLETRCARYSNIKIRPEIRGDGRWKDLDWEGSKFMSVATEDFTPQSPVWSSFPDDLHGHDKKDERTTYRALSPRHGRHP